MKNKIYSFRDENGNLVNYTVKEHLLINKNDYVLMCPENDASHIEAYKFTNDSLELIENEKELSMIKSISKVM
ncbi:DUF1292 domain-containing protein [Clostridium hydrogeniformans]|uniref:DUF1292 domain-containing protein n=1 Tax=Clostridium hydrogeniformans TaxID=349933 RepID=UPI0004868118|nr:DUF1292 domain-containing protein [Clostridium hydrogeniformans]